MDNVIEIIKIVGAFLGPILGAIALVLQRASENRQAKATAETTLSSDAREWTEDFRDEMRLAKEEATKAGREVRELSLKLIAAEGSITVLNNDIRRIMNENAQLSASLHAIQERNTSLEAEMRKLSTQNVELRKEVVTLQQENSSLRSTVDQQTRQIEQLQNGVKGKGI